MAGTTTTLSTAIREAQAPGFEEEVFRNNSLFRWFPPMTPSPGDTNFRWKVNSSGNASVGTFSEGDSLPAAGNQTYVNAAVPYNFFSFTVEITDHLRAALKSRWFDAISNELTLGRGDLIDLMTTTAMSGTNGLETAVDSTTTYAGIARGSAGYWESTETAVSGPIAHTDLLDLLEGIRDNDKGGTPGLWLMPLNQGTNIYNLTGGPGVQNIGDSDKAPGFLNQSFAGIPMVQLPDWTNTVIMCLDMSPGKWEHAEHIPFSVFEVARTGYADLLLVEQASILIDKRPKRDGKLTGVTA
jgi:hypothetical protein